MAYSKLRGLQGCATMALLIGCGSSSGNNNVKDPAGGGDGGSGGGMTVSGGTGATSGTSPVVEPPPHIVVDCDAAEVGKWEDITPPDVLKSARWTGKMGYGVAAMVIDPTNTANVTLGTDGMGIHRTTDCGATWKPANTGENAAILSGGVNWTMNFDYFDPNTIYTVAGYGTNGVFKTTNGGKDWHQTLGPEYGKNFVFGGFTAQVRTDPMTAGHLIITPHFTCENGNSETCFMESMDGGEHWSVVQDAPSGGEGARLTVVDKNTWFSGVGLGGLYRTGDAGKSWKLVTPADGYAYEVYHRPGGKYYLPVAFGVAVSDDGITWTQLDKSPGAHVVVASDTHIYASTGNFCVFSHDQPINPIVSAPIDDPTNWTVDTTYSNKFGAGDLQYDVDHHILYVPSCFGGLWRVRTE